MKPVLLLCLLLSKALFGDDIAENLAKAARDGDVKTIQSLVNAGVNVDLPDQYGHTAVYYATAFNQAKAVEVLLGFHADPNTPVSKHFIIPQPPATPLQYAAELGNRQVAFQLIAAGAHIDGVGPTGRTPLYYAFGHLDLLQMLLDEGANVNVRDTDGTSPLDEAVWFDLLDVAAILLAHGADLNAPEPETGATPINEAAYKGHARLVRYLLQFHPNLEVADKKGYTPLDNAIRMGKEDSAVLLLEVQRPTHLVKALETAIKKDEGSVVENLLRLGDVKALPSGTTLLDAAAFSGAEHVVNVLLKQNADPNQEGANGSFPLTDAALKGFDSIVTALLEHGARVNQINREAGISALYSAASFGKASTVDLLLKRGADPNLCSTGHKSPLAAATENSFKDIAARLQQAGAKMSCHP
jgi:cytohesin